MPAGSTERKRLDGFFRPYLCQGRFPVILTNVYVIIEGLGPADRVRLETGAEKRRKERTKSVKERMR
jgi:hypothetical protein